MKIITKGTIDWATLRVEDIESYEYDGPVAQCGSLSYALGGGLAGLGQGMAEVGKETYLDQLARNRDDTHERLRDMLARERIANDQAFQLKGAAAGREFATQQQHEKLASEEARAAAREKGATARTHESVEGRKYAADRLTERDANKPANQPKPMFTHLRDYQVPGVKADSVAGTPATPGYTIHMVTDGKEEFMSVPYGNGQRWVRAPASGPGNTKMPVINSVDVRKIDPRGEQHTIDNPESMMDFLDQYKSLSDRQVQTALRSRPRSPAGVPNFMPPGTTVHEPASPSTPGMRPTSSNQGSGAATQDVLYGDYGEYGDLGHQSSDDAPAP